MKIFKKILLVCLILMVGMSIKAKAVETAVSDNDVTLELSSAEAKLGDKIQIDISAKSATGIGGLDSVLTWDKTKLKFVNEASFPLSGIDDSSEKFYLSVLYDGDDTEADLGTLEFEVLDTAKVGDILNIGLSDIEIVDVNYNGIKINDKQVSITIIGAEGSGEVENESEENTNTLTEIKITQAPTKTTYKVGEKFDKTGMVITATYSDGTTKEISSYTYSPVAELTAEDKEIIITYTEGEVKKTVTQKITVEAAKEEVKEEVKETDKEESDKKDPTIADKNINDAGSEGWTIILIVSILLIAIVLYAKYKKYSDIK